MCARSHILWINTKKLQIDYMYVPTKKAEKKTKKTTASESIVVRKKTKRLYIYTQYNHKLMLLL